MTAPAKPYRLVIFEPDDAGDSILSFESDTPSLCRRSRRTCVASHAGPILVGFLFALAMPLSGQGTPGHSYHVNYYQVRPGQEKAYDSALAHVVSPVFDEMVKRKAVVSYLLLTKVAGSGAHTHLVIVEVATPSAAQGVFQQQLEAASQATLHRSWDDATVAFPDLRRFVHAEQYTTVGQGP
jgi:hypothetical protein